MYISSSPHFPSLKSLHLFLLMCKMRLSFILKEAAVQRLLITPYCQKHTVSLSIMANFMIWEVETAVKRFFFHHQFLASATFSYAYTPHLQSKDFCTEASNYYLGHPPSIIQGNWNSSVKNYLKLESGLEHSLKHTCASHSLCGRWNNCFESDYISPFACIYTVGVLAWFPSGQQHYELAHNICSSSVIIHALWSISLLVP